MARLRATDGSSDLLPDRLAVIRHVIAACRRVCTRFGYREVQPALFEERSLFERALAEERIAALVDLATLPRGEVALALRPCVWPGLVRAYLQHAWDKTPALRKLCGFGPTVDFPPGSPPRQVERAAAVALGASSPALDAEAIALAYACLTAAGLGPKDSPPQGRAPAATSKEPGDAGAPASELRVAVSTVGDAVDQARYQEALRTHFAPLADQRCDACRAALVAHPSRLLTCKAKGCQASNRSAPNLVDALGEGSRRRLQQVLGHLRAAHVPYDVDATLLRDEGVATHTVFEVRTTAALGDVSLCRGARRDTVVAALEGPKLGLIEFELDVGAVADALARQEPHQGTSAEDEVEVFVVPAADDARPAAFTLTQQLRGGGVAADTDYEDRPAKALRKQLDKRAVPFVLIVAAAPDAPVTLVARDGSAETTLAATAVVAELRRRLGR